MASGQFKVKVFLMCEFCIMNHLPEYHVIKKETHFSISYGYQKCENDTCIRNYSFYYIDFLADRGFNVCTQIRGKKRNQLKGYTIKEMNEKFTADFVIFRPFLLISSSFQ